MIDIIIGARLSKVREVDRHLPLKAVDFHILLVLAESDRHGYGIVKEIEARSDGRLRLEPGNLYRYIRKLVDDGLVEPAERRAVAAARHAAGSGSFPGDRPRGAEAEDSGTTLAGAGASSRRRYYRVTDRGRHVLAAEAARMRTLALAAERRLAAGGEP